MAKGSNYTNSGYHQSLNLHTNLIFLMELQGFLDGHGVQSVINDGKLYVEVQATTKHGATYKSTEVVTNYGQAKMIVMQATPH